jgi:hypothetical protein
MPRHISFVLLGFALFGTACSGSTISLGVTDQPVNDVPCTTRGEHRGACRCADDQHWLCAGQNSVTCRSVYGSGGGRLLVNADMPCEMKWSECSDDRVYGVRCDGLHCTCSVNGADDVRFITPRCADMSEAATVCGWSLHQDPHGGGGSGPMQGVPCGPVGQVDDSTGIGCVCAETGWDCATGLACPVSATWKDTRDPAGERRLAISADGTLFWSDTAAATREQIASGEASGFIGTWAVDGQVLFVKAESKVEPACETKASAYTPAFGADCSTVHLSEASDACTPRSALGGLEAAR